ncbi:MAG: hypothetical protein DRR08_00415 [Candidatus Parabeggiatoa sp. nov. 2]|nr:MAG: hypothetical protein B6247_02765 [Beggiatoa sp. 4572_84]RKZ64514.1 MAG: hypothetical protein DRR08_00415 [Gammaproteobacteria bacterium]
MNAIEPNVSILIVKDTSENADILIEPLKKAPLNIAIARSGEEALQMVDNIFPDIILLDIQLPGLDNFETYRRLKQLESLRAVLVIFVTTLTEIRN